MRWRDTINHEESELLIVAFFRDLFNCNRFYEKIMNGGYPTSVRRSRPLNAFYGPCGLVSNVVGARERRDFS